MSVVIFIDHTRMLIMQGLLPYLLVLGILKYSQQSVNRGEPEKEILGKFPNSRGKGGLGWKMLWLHFQLFILGSDLSRGWESFGFFKMLKGVFVLQTKDQFPNVFFLRIQHILKHSISLLSVYYIGQKTNCI